MYYVFSNTVLSWQEAGDVEESNSGWKTPPLQQSYVRGPNNDCGQDHGNSGDEVDRTHISKNSDIFTDLSSSCHHSPISVLNDECFLLPNSEESSSTKSGCCVFTISPLQDCLTASTVEERIVESSANSVGSSIASPSSSSSYLTRTKAIGEQEKVDRDGRELDRKRRILINFHHGATCTFDGCSHQRSLFDHRAAGAGQCPKHHRCIAVRRLYDHVIHCSRSGNIDNNTGLCKVPGCSETRKVWKHYLYCQDVDCLICCIIPSATPQDPITLQKKSRPQNMIQRTSSCNIKGGRPPLSPRRRHGSSYYLEYCEV